MPILTYPQIVDLTFSDLNASVGIGDYVSYTPVSTSGGFLVNSSSSLTYFGNVISIDESVPSSIIVQVLYHGNHDQQTNIDNDNTWLPGDVPNEYLVPLPSNTDFIVFTKNNVVNTSSLVGYYASIDFVNTSQSACELFSIGSEISESSK
tara:strand:- start:936 stop:1385 length:450 start_codon:yes stop_codon:yes gene_type:complete